MISSKIINRIHINFIYLKLYMMSIVEVLKKNTYYLYDVFGVYLLWIALFYSASHLHTYYCTPKGIFGFISTPILIQAPHCVSFRWIISTGTTNINMFWTILAGLLVKKVMIT